MYAMKKRLTYTAYYIFSIAYLGTATKRGFAAALSAPQQKPLILDIFSLHKVHLRGNNHSSSRSGEYVSPWCYAATVDPTRETPPSPEIQYNFLAFQVWPSARTASFFLERHIDAIKQWKVCELGCGPALPSLVMARLGVPHVIATDLDELALQMVSKAAEDQELDNLTTKCVDLTGDTAVIKDVNADLYIMSDVFENTPVAKGAARMTMAALESGSKVWAFAQSDRAQRDIFLNELKDLGAEDYTNLMQWEKCEDYLTQQQLCDRSLILFDLDEITVDYG